MELEGKKVAILVANDYEDPEFWYPYYRMKEAGAEVVVVGASDGPEVALSKHGYPVKVDLKADEADPEEFDAVIIPGGWAPDRLRRCHATLGFVRALFAQDKVVAAICHGPQVLISAQVVGGAKITSATAIKDDLGNAGSHWIDSEVVVDENLISSRSPADLPAFAREIIKVMKSER